MEIAGIVIGGINLLLLIILLLKKSPLSILQTEIENNKQEMLNNMTSLQEQMQIQTDDIKQETLNNLTLLQEQMQIQTDDIKQETLNNITSLQELIQKQTNENKKDILNNMDSLSKQIQEQSEEIQLIQHSCKLNSEHILALLNYKDPNLDPQASHWILENEKFKKIFAPGKLEKVTYDNGTTELHYEYKNKNILCSKYVDGVLKTKTVLNQFSVPIEGYLYNKEGSVINKFVYDSLGQLTSK